MAKDYSNIAKQIVERVGGSDNIVSLVNCMTRLRFVLKDESRVASNLEQTEGVIRVMYTGGQVQVVIGTHVADVKAAIETETGRTFGGTVDEDGEATTESGEKKNIFSRTLNGYVSVVSGIFMPVMGAMAGAALLKAFVIMISTFGWMDTETSTYQILYGLSDAFFYFLPIFLAVSSAEKFKANKYVAAIIATALIYPGIMDLMNSEGPVTFFGIPVTIINYTSTVLPIIVTVYVQSLIEGFFKKYMSKTIQFFMTPALTLLIVVPLALIVIGPITDVVGRVIGQGIGSLMDFSPILTALVFGFLWQIMILFGIHWGMIPIIMGNLSLYGGDPMLPIVNGATFSMAGVVLAILVITKKDAIKKVAIPAFISSFVGGITEPAIYGLTLKYKRPFLISCLVTGITGIPMAFADVMWPSVMSVNILTLPALYAIGGSVVIVNAVAAFVLGFILTYFFGFKDSMVKE